MTPVDTCGARELSLMNDSATSVNSAATFTTMSSVKNLCDRLLSSSDCMVARDADRLVVILTRSSDARERDGRESCQSQVYPPLSHRAQLGFLCSSHFTRRVLPTCQPEII